MGARAAGAEHHVGGQQHYHGKQPQLPDPRHPFGKVGPQVGAGHARQAKKQHVAPVYLGLEGVGYGPHQGNQAHDGQRLGDGQFVGLPHQVDQDGHREDGAARAQHAQGQANQNCPHPG